MTSSAAAERLTTLSEHLRGTVLLPGDDGFDAARATWNGMIDRHPAAIVRCRGTADVIAAVNHARESGLPVSIRAGGHNVAGKAICDDGIVVDLSLMNDVRVDPAARRARAGGGAQWQDFDHEAQAFGLTTTGGVVSSTGVAGLTLGGGIGYLTRSHGLACDNLMAADVVTADGRLVHASESENADLLWGLRGGGGNFGVVTSLEFQLHPVGPMVAAATVFHAMDTASEVLRLYRNYALSAPDDVVCYAMIVNPPPDFPPEHQGKPLLAIVGCCSGTVEDGLRLLAPLAEWGSPLVTAIDAMPYVVLQQAFNAGNPHGGRYYWKSQHLTELPDDLIDTVVRLGNDLHGSLSIIGIEQLGGAMSRIAPNATAFPYRNVPFSLSIWGGWPDAADDEANIAWCRTFFDTVKPFGAGVYANYVGADEADRIEEAYGDNYARLRELKKKWDPDNLFSELAPSRSG